MNAKEIRAYFQQQQELLLNSIYEIVEIESPSFDVEGSRKVVSWIESELAKIPLDLIIEKTFAEEYGEHLIIRKFSTGGKPCFILGHTDTVHPVGAKLQNPTRIEDGKFYGCGIFDMKANIVLMLAVLRFLAENKIENVRPFTIMLSCDEEIGSFTGREIVEREAANAEFCLVCEPSANGKVKTARKGTGMFTVKTHGIPAHAGLEPEKGASAILEISKQIPKIHELNNLEKGTTANVCQIHGGTASNVIPEHAECLVDVRFSSMSEAVKVENAIKNLQSTDERVSIAISGAINRPPMERTEKVVALYEKAKNLAASFDYQLGETQVGGASDGNFVGALGVPLIDGLGVAGNGAHTLDEYILIDDLANRATLMTLLLLSE
ncbi:MAG: M20 family metallopeptidase [Pyrinomonadaceae bacterium]|nr:M20 family metallopeptidase [Pyrinomonadaceae bacterium]